MSIKWGRSKCMDVLTHFDSGIISQYISGCTWVYVVWYVPNLLVPLMLRICDHTTTSQGLGLHPPSASLNLYWRVRISFADNGICYHSHPVECFCPWETAKFKLKFLRSLHGICMEFAEETVQGIVLKVCMSKCTRCVYSSTCVTGHIV